MVFYYLENLNLWFKDQMSKERDVQKSTYRPKGFSHVLLIVSLVNHCQSSLDHRVLVLVLNLVIIVHVLGTAVLTLSGRTPAVVTVVGDGAAVFKV